MPSPDDSRSWDWSAPFDDDFVAAAGVQEESAEVRAERARRIAQAHRRREGWRSPDGSPGASFVERRASRWGGTRRASGRGSPVLAAITVAVVVLGLLINRTSWSALVGLDPTAAPGASGPSFPRPPDAQDGRVLPVVAAPAGDGGYRLLNGDGGRPPRFDPCRPVHWAMRPDGAPADAVALVTEAFAALSRATGLLFVYDGATPEAPSADRQPVQQLYGKRAAPVLVAWSDAAATSRLAGRVAGFAGPYGYDPDGRGLRYVTGQVVLDAVDFLSIPLLGRSGVVLHELGHLAGLDHVNDPGDTMYPSGNTGGSYSVGALRGLAFLGNGRCFP